MKKIMLVVMMLTTIVMLGYAGSKKLSNGATVVWQDQVYTSSQGDAKVTVSVSNTCDFNIIGSVTCGGQSQNLFIEAGSASTTIYFGGLRENSNYSVSVNIQNTKAESFSGSKLQPTSFPEVEKRRW